MVTCEEVAIDVTMEKMLTGEHIFTEKLAVTLRSIMIRHRLPILKMFFKCAYFIKEEALNRVGKAKQGGIVNNCFRDRFCPEIKLGSGHPVLRCRFAGCWLEFASSHFA